MILHKKRLYIIIAGTLLVMLILIAGLISVISGGSDNPGSEPMSGEVNETPVATPTAHATPGIVVFGYVRDSADVGIENVEIFRQYASYPGTPIATSGKGGYYQSDFYFIPGDEMVTVWAEYSGMKFEPEFRYWRHYYGHERIQLDFHLVQTGEVFLPIVNK